MQRDTSRVKLTCEQDPSRVDVNGAAYAESQRQIQRYVDKHPQLLNEAIAKCLLLQLQGLDVEWVSPIKSEKYREYRDGDFLRHLGLERFTLQLRKFWPRRGPCWDALGRFSTGGNDGYVLVEAKSHIPEIYGRGSTAAGRSLELIEKSLTNTKAWLGIDAGTSWIGPLYQSANRFAHLYFRRQIAGVDAYLINLHFINDPHSPTARDIWAPAIAQIDQELGLKKPVPFSGSVFLEALDDAVHHIA